MLTADETLVEADASDVFPVRAHGRRAARSQGMLHDSTTGSWTLGSESTASTSTPSGTSIQARFLSLDMQPIVNLRTGKVARVQALARLNLGDGVVQVESEYLPLLTVDQLDALFRHEVLEAATWLRRWDDAGLELCISLTVGSSTLLAPGFSRWLTTTADRFGIARERLTLEVIETQGVSVAAGRDVIEELAFLGFGFGLDEYGAGPRSIDTLGDIPFRTIKTDRELLAHLRTKPLPTIGLLAAVAQLGVDFHRDVIIQGIEDDTTLEVASILGITYGQGAFLGVPIAAEHVAQLISGFNATPRGSIIRSLIGAIAYQVKIDRTPYGSHPEMERCPLTPFLEGLDGQGVLMHEAVHAAGFEHHAESEALTRWLVEQLGGVPARV